MKNEQTLKYGETLLQFHIGAQGENISVWRCPSVEFALHHDNGVWYTILKGSVVRGESPQEALSNRWEKMQSQPRQPPLQPQPLQPQPQPQPQSEPQTQSDVPRLPFRGDALREEMLALIQDAPVGTAFMLTAVLPDGSTRLLWNRHLTLMQMTYVLANWRAIESDRVKKELRGGPVFTT